MGRRPNMSDSKIRKNIKEMCYNDLIKRCCYTEDKYKRNINKAENNRFFSLTRKVENINYVDNQTIITELKEIYNFVNISEKDKNKDEIYFNVLWYLNKKIMHKKISSEEASAILIKYVDPNYEMLLKEEEEIDAYLKDFALFEKKIYLNELRNIKHYMNKYNLTFDESIKHLIKIVKEKYDSDKNYKEEEHTLDENFEYFSRVYKNKF